MSKTKPSAELDNPLRTPPHNDEAERAVLGSILIDNKVIGAVASLLQVESFYRESHRLIWLAMLALHQREQVIDVLTLADELHSRKQLADVGGDKVLGRLSTEVPSAVVVGYYAKIVADDAAQRAAIGQLMPLVAGIYDDTVRADQISGELQRIAGLIAPVNAARTVGEGATLAEEWDAWCDDAAGVGGGASTGVPELDRLIDGGLHVGRSYYIGGLSKQGKTTLCVAVAAHMATRAGWAVEFLSCEMSRPELMTRLIASAARVDIKRYLYIRRLLTG